MRSDLIHRLVFSVTAACACLCSQASGQTDIYITRYFSSDGRTLYATTTTTGSFSTVVGCSGYTHNYYATASLTGPAGVTATGGGTVGSGSVNACGTGTATSTAQISTVVDGAYYASSSETADCSYYGEFLDANQPPEQEIGAPVINPGGVTDALDTSMGWEYVDTSGYISIWGPWLDADKTDMNPQVTVDDPTHIQLGTPSYVSDGQINVPFTIMAGVATGGGSPHNITVTTTYGTSEPPGELYIYDATPAIQSVSQTPWTAGSTYSGVTISGSNFGTICPSVAISGAGATTFTVTTGSCTNSSVQGTVRVDPNATGSSPSVNATLTLTSGGYGQGFQSAPGGSSQAPFPGVEVLAAAPTITGATLSPNVVGSNGATMTINGTGLSGATPYLPSGFSITKTSGSSTQMTLTVNIALSVSYGTNCCYASVQSAAGKSSGSAVFTVDGPGYLVVTGSSMGHCGGCSTTVKLLETYQIMNGVSKTAFSTTVPVCETPVLSNWSCSQAQSGMTYNRCNVNPGTATGGAFTDGWGLTSDTYTPVGCGYPTSGGSQGITDEWLFNPAGATVQWKMGNLYGYILTNSVSINGYVDGMPVGTPDRTMINHDRIIEVTEDVEVFFAGSWGDVVGRRHR